MSKSKFQKHQQPLTTLQSMINGVLIETGKALRAANQKGPKTIGHTHAGLQASIPGAIESFHLALDELEIDIVRAKAVLGRDLQELRSKRNQLENPTMQQVAMTERGGLHDTSFPDVIGVETSEASVEAHEVIKKEDLITENADAMDIISPKIELNATAESPSQNPPAHTESGPQESVQKPVEVPASEIQAGSDELNNTRGPVNPDTDHGLGITISDAAPSAASEAPATGGLQSTTFDELFDDNNGATDLNFDDFNFSGDGGDNQNDDFGGNAGGFDLSSFGNQTSNDDGDPSSMLQSLESFGDGNGGPFNLLDMSNNAADNQGPSDNAGDDFGMSGGELDVALGMVANESTFDDLLEGMDFGDTDDGTGGDMMEHGQFDEDFFGLNSNG